MAWCRILSEPDFPYDKKPKEPVKDEIVPPPPSFPPEPPGHPPSPPPMISQTPSKFTCQTCGKVFNSREELTMHVETVHQSPKKKV